MVARLSDTRIEPGYVRLLVLGYGLSHAYRVLAVDQIASGLPLVGRKELKEALERLADEGLVTRFSGRFCFNKQIPPEIKSKVDAAVSPSGTVKAVRPKEPLEPPKAELT
ncbi:MAG TPA: hypothetical protein VFB82_21865 [Blastocatellia bacterium]|nr:hypothetical protein [Blastocatellia bacterium]